MKNLLSDFKKQSHSTKAVIAVFILLVLTFIAVFILLVLTFVGALIMLFTTASDFIKAWIIEGCVIFVFIFILQPWLDRHM